MFNLREYAAQIDEQGVGMKEKAEEFVLRVGRFIKVSVRLRHLSGSVNERRRRGILVAPGGAKRNPGITTIK